MQLPQANRRKRRQDDVRGKQARRAEAHAQDDTYKGRSNDERDQSSDECEREDAPRRPGCECSDFLLAALRSKRCCSIRDHRLKHPERDREDHQDGEKGGERAVLRWPEWTANANVERVVRRVQ